MVNAFSHEYEEKKNLVKFTKEINEEYDIKKKERDLDIFKQKQSIMQENTAFLWAMKERYLNDVHNKQMDRMELYWKIKKDLATEKDFKKKLENK